MVFKKKVENGGLPDPNINIAGRRPAGEKKPTNRDLRERELVMLLRKIRPHVADSIMQAAKIMKDESAAHQNQLKAATILLDNYRKLVMDLYEGEDPDDEGTEIQRQNQPTFSLKMINGDKPEED